MTAMPTGRRLLNAKAILKEAGLTLDKEYADFGAGTLGHFVFPASDMVGPNSNVYAVDILKNALNAIKNRAQLEQIHNIIPVWGDIEREKGVSIPPASLDVISMINIGSLIIKSPMVLKEAARLLKPGGVLVVADWEPIEQVIGPPLETRVAEEAVKPAVLQAEYRYVKSFEAGPHHWGMLFKRGQ